MATKYTVQTLEGDVLKTVSKKQAAIKAGEGLLGFRVVTDAGTVVFEKIPETTQVVEDPSDAVTEHMDSGDFKDDVSSEEDLIGDVEPVFYERLDFPGNYSIVTAPLAVEIAEAAGVPTKVETFKGKLVRRVHFGGTDMDLAARTTSLVQATVAEALETLRVWQKENIEKRRGLTDMQRYNQHRDFIAAHGAKVAKKVKKDGV